MGLSEPLLVSYWIILKSHTQTRIVLEERKPVFRAGFYTKLNVWGSLGLNFDYDGSPIIENGGPLFLYKRRTLGGSTSFREGIGTGLSCQTGVPKHQVIFASPPFVAT